MQKSHSIDTNVLIQSTSTCRFDQYVGVVLIDIGHQRFDSNVHSFVIRERAMTLINLQLELD